MAMAGPPPESEGGLEMSAAPTYLAPRTQTRRWNTNEIAGVSWRALTLAVALSSLLALALVQRLAGEHRPPAPVAPSARSTRFSHEGLLSLPLAAQGPASATVGAYAPVYRVSAS